MPDLTHRKGKSLGSEVPRLFGLSNVSFLKSKRSIRDVRADSERSAHAFANFSAKFLLLFRGNDVYDGHHDGRNEAGGVLCEFQHSVVGVYAKGGTNDLKVVLLVGGVQAY